MDIKRSRATQSDIYIWQGKVLTFEIRMVGHKSFPSHLCVTSWFHGTVLDLLDKSGLKQS